jgi:hypothetical protein
MISEFRKSDSPVHFQRFIVNAPYLDHMTTTLLCTDGMAKILSLALRSNDRDIFFVPRSDN